LYPLPNETSFIETTDSPEYVHFEIPIDVIKRTIANSHSSSSAGASGLSNAHLKYFMNNEKFLLCLKNTYEKLINVPETVDIIPELF